ncbi:MAG TPA: DUF5658 family protein [Bryobacteraceae bacterium]|jgi:hypothetical protein|nr:DUF5658 family protein [Bryobacteraceae bacterium]
MPARARDETVGNLLLNFIYLQLLDLLTTLAFLVHGVQEANPVVRLALQLAPNPIVALAGVKALAVSMGLYCSSTGRHRILSRMNVLFAVVVVWNLIILVIAALRQ